MEHFLEWRDHDRVLTRVTYNPAKQVVIKVENLTDYWLDKFLVEETFEGLRHACASRVLPEERYLREPEIQRLVGSVTWDPIRICHLTAGLLPTDDNWVWFDSYPKGLKYADICYEVRRS